MPSVRPYFSACDIQLAFVWVYICSECNVLKWKEWNIENKCHQKSHFRFFLKNVKQLKDYRAHLC